MTALSSATLSGLRVSTPGYDREAARVGIVHFGFGNFHRSHEAMYVDALMEVGGGQEWGICGVGELTGRFYCRRFRSRRRRPGLVNGSSRSRSGKASI